MGDNALARFDHDVIAQPHASTVILMMGINDIGWPGMLLDPNAKEPTAEDITNGYRQLIQRAHEHGLRVLGATLTPFEDTFKGGPLEGYYNPEKEKIREAVNDWIRHSGEFDGVIDFDALTRDQADPHHIRAEYNSGDNLHPNDAAYETMAGVTISASRTGSCARAFLWPYFLRSTTRESRVRKPSFFSGAAQVRLVIGQRLGEAVAHRAGLAGKAAAGDGDGQVILRRGGWRRRAAG